MKFSFFEMWEGIKNCCALLFDLLQLDVKNNWCILLFDSLQLDIKNNGVYYYFIYYN